MPEIGDEVRAEEIGKVGRAKHVWVFCPSCKEERWTMRQSNASNTFRLCKPCNIRINAKRFHI